MTTHPDTAEPRRVFLVDDHPLVREWLAALIACQADLVVCGEADSAPKALSGIMESQPDIVIVDLSLGSGRSGLDLIKDIATAQEGVAILVLSMHEEPIYAERALRAGAAGYVAKREATKNIITAIREVLAGKLFLSGKLALAMARKTIHPAKESSLTPLEILSDREFQIFEMLGNGAQTRRIALDLNLSMKTVQAYCARIKEKLGITTAHELLREAVLWHERQSVADQ
jgi:DNA-binding NarL/FixJ family response regulator